MTSYSIMNTAKQMTSTKPAILTESSYEEVVKEWYFNLLPVFTSSLLNRYRGTGMSLDDAEDIYQDIFLAIHKNMKEGRVPADTAWQSYIMRIGFNLASKRWRSVSRNVSIDETTEEEGDELSLRARSISDEKLSEIPDDSDNLFLERDPEVLEIMHRELDSMPETAATILRMTYLAGKTDVEIALAIPAYRDNGKSAAVNAKAVKARRWLCLRDFKQRVGQSLFRAGIIESAPAEKTPARTRQRVA